MLLFSHIIKRLSKKMLQRIIIRHILFLIYPDFVFILAVLPLTMEETQYIQSIYDRIAIDVADSNKELNTKIYIPDIPNKLSNDNYNKFDEALHKAKEYLESQLKKQNPKISEGNRLAYNAKLLEIDSKLLKLLKLKN